MAVSLAACATGSTSEGAGEQVPLEDEQTLQMLNYSGWMGEGNVSGYEAENPQVTINESDIPSGGVGGIVTLLRENSGAYDFALLGSVSAGTADAQGILADFHAADVPNLENVPQEYRDAYPWGIPLEQGKVGIIYRTDTVQDPPTSWAELFERLPEFDGRVAFPDYDLDVFSMALLAMGEDINTDDPAILEEAAAMITEAKPHLRAFMSSDIISALNDGSVDIAVGYDYTTAGVLGVDPNIGWIAPSEGVPAYLDGWPIFADSTHQPATLDFMNYMLDLENYADFINTTGAAYLIPEVEPLLDPSIVENEALAYDPDVTVHFEQFVSGEINAKRAELWEQIKSS
jgi:spermidine/putrescine-binding protein